VWHQEVLMPQFTYEVEHLLPWYVSIEKVLLLEYARMGLADAGTIAAMATRLGHIDPAAIRADPHENMSDITFAIERYVTTGPVPPFPAWHVDRSRNDLQATAQLLAARIRVLDAIDALLGFSAAIDRLASGYVDTPMPGYTHLQPAQIITPAFYLTAIGIETLHTLRRLIHTFDEMDECPLGAGAMAGQELPWDRERMARLLGFSRVAPHALVAVATRGWALSVSTDLSSFGVATSRFATDLMAWGSGEYGFIDLPDELSGISSAMPQKKNFPILERIRGRSAHLTGFAAALAAGQRNTPYTNMVEVSKESSAHLGDLFDTLQSIVRLFTAVIEHMRFCPVPMYAACERDYLGGFTLANLLTLRAKVPWRTAQVIAGKYVVQAGERRLAPSAPDGALLARLAAEAGFRVDGPDRLLADAFSVNGGLNAKQSVGSTNPGEVSRMLEVQESEVRTLAGWSASRRADIDRARAGIDAAFEVCSSSRERRLVRPISHR
jgi:argininosuccinate lyase